MRPDKGIQRWQPCRPFDQLSVSECLQKLLLDPLNLEVSLVPVFGLVQADIGLSLNAMLLTMPKTVHVLRRKRFEHRIELFHIEARINELSLPQVTDVCFAFFGQQAKAACQSDCCALGV